MIEPMEGFGGLFGDPEEMRRRMEELQEQMQGAQKVAWADNAIKLADEMTVAARWAKPTSSACSFSSPSALVSTATPAKLSSENVISSVV